MAALRWSPGGPTGRSGSGSAGLIVAAAVLGVMVRQRRALLVSLHERAARLEFERDQEGRLGAAPSGPGSPARCTTSSPTT